MTIICDTFRDPCFEHVIGPPFDPLVMDQAALTRGGFGEFVRSQPITNRQ